MLAGVLFSHAFSGKLKAVSVVNETIQDRVYQGWDHRTSQNAVILDRLVSEVTITDPQHSLFGQRLALTNERSGRGPAYVVVRLPDGRRRSIRISATDLNASDCLGCTPAASLPRISVRILIPLAQHLDRILNLLTEEVIRDEPTSPSASSRCVSTTDPGREPRLSAAAPHLWPTLSPQTQVQLACILAELLRRMMPTQGVPERETSHVDRRQRR